MTAPILITRPAGKADNLLASMDEAGISYLYQPLITTQQVALKAKDIQALEQAELVIFVSVSAVVSLQQQLAVPVFNCPVCAVGDTTASVLRRWLTCDIMVPEDQRSEGILALPQLQQMQHRQVVIVRGNSGRELMKQTFQARGATVKYVQSYRRVPLPLDGAILCRQWQQQQISCIVVTSNEILQLIFSLLPPEQHRWLQQRYWIMVSPRMRDSAVELGIAASQIILAANANDLSLLEAVSRFKREYQ
ncbi:uroporphyrinogen-III synthase [Chromatiaceae bacterium AAb-1]|nr:uroporphyrinogen-III synthase [Chromatiaceae bacterium AAb-1]